LNSQQARTDRAAQAGSMNIQWFPGHMTKARRMIEDNLTLIDAVCEIIDARIPYSSRNPDVGALTRSKPRLVIFNRADQADPAATRLWLEYFRANNTAVLETDSSGGRGISAFPSAIKSLLRAQIEARREKGQEGRPLRCMVLGIPNVGKSTFINKVAGRRAANASDKPGVTRGRQWIAADKTLELLDTPGILWPRFDNAVVGENLAFTGAIRDEILDRETLAARLMTKLAERYPAAPAERYKIEVPEPPATRDTDEYGFGLLSQSAKKRGFLISGGELDLGRMAAILLDEFRGGRLGRITLELPNEV